jgi:hypothetical protein
MGGLKYPQGRKDHHTASSAGSFERIPVKEFDVTIFVV